MTVKPKFTIRFYDKEAEKEYKHLNGYIKKVDIGLRKLSVRADEIGKILTGELSDYKELTHSKDDIRIIYRIDEYQVEIVAIIPTFNLVDDEVFKIVEAMESFKRKAK